MIISCPACATRYNIDHKALGDKGRKVRCSNCAHQWIQAPPMSEEDMDLPQGLRDALAPEQEDDETDPWDGSGDDQVLDQFGVDDHLSSQLHEMQEDDDLNASQRVLQEINQQSYQEEIPEHDSSSDDVQEEKHYYQTEDIDAAFGEDIDQDQNPKFPVGWVVFIVFLIIFAAILFFAKETILELMPQSKDVFEKMEMSEDGASATSEGLRLLQPRIQQQTVQYGTQQVEVYELVGDIVNNSEQEIRIPKLRAVVLDGQQKQLDSWIFTANKAILAAGERTSYSTEVENSNEQDVNIIIDFVAEDK